MNKLSAACEAIPPLAHVESVVRKSGTSFYWAMRFLPVEKRQAMFAVYAFCRQVDDIADESGAVTTKRVALANWRQAIDRVYAGIADRPVTAALVRPVERFGLRKEDFHAVIDGMEMDADLAIRIADVNQLLLYCDRVACAVGRLAVRVFGVMQPTGDQLASALGQALQLTNILRDLKEDARRDRLYLPTELLREHGISVGSDEAEAVLRHAAIADACEQLARLATRRFGEAASLVSQCDRSKVRPAVIMMEVYRRTLARLNGRGWGRWAEPVCISPAEKLWVALRYGML
jgi:phytoene synthase